MHKRHSANTRAVPCVVCVIAQKNHGYVFVYKEKIVGQSNLMLRRHHRFLYTLHWPMLFSAMYEEEPVGAPEGSACGWRMLTLMPDAKEGLNAPREDTRPASLNSNEPALGAALCAAVKCWLLWSYTLSLNRCCASQCLLWSTTHN